MNRIKKIIEKNQQKLIIGFTVFLLVLGLINILLTIEVNVTSNDECLWVPKYVENKDSVAIEFELVKEGGVTWNAGIRNGDYLVGINGIKIKNPQHAQQILNKVEEGDYADYEVKKSSGEILNTKVYVKKLVNFFQLALSLLGVIWLVVGFIVVTAKPDGYVQRRFYAIGTTLVMISTVGFLNLDAVQNSYFLSIFFDLVFTFGFVFAPFLVVHFFLIFPKELGPIKNNKFRKALYIIPIAIFIVVILHRAVFIYGSDNPQFYYQIFNTVGNGLFFAGFNFGLIALIINYVKIKSKSERKPLFSILFAYILGIASATFAGFVAPAIADTIFNSPEYYMPIVIMAIIPIAFAFSIFKYQLMDVSVVVKNTITYGIATLSFAAAYFLVIYLLGQSISSAIGTEYQGVIAGAIFIVFAVVFQSSKDKFHDLITAKFYPEQFAYQNVLVRFSSEVSGKVGLDNILDYTKNTLVDALIIEYFGIMIWDQSNGSHILVREKGIKNKNLEINAHNLPKNIREKIQLSKIPVIERDEFDEVFEEHSEKLKEENIYTILPMIIKSKVVGLLLFGLKHSGSKFAGKDLELLFSASSQAAVAIENARLYESEAQKFKLERDLDLARKIQQGLLPKCIPDTNGLDICGEMIPAMQVGGDYFDLIPVSDSKLFVVVGDVSGKGLAASLYMTKLQTMIQLACTIDKSPKEILHDVNRRMYSSLEKNSFVTITLALFDMENRIVRFCRAGHMPILISLNGKVEYYQSQGLGVGLEKGTIFERTLVEEVVELKNNQIFAFFSDGITEAIDETNELFGDENLNKILVNKSHKRSSEIMNELWNEVKTFRGKAEQNDDMTMVLVKVCKGE